MCAKHNRTSRFPRIIHVIVPLSSINGVAYAARECSTLADAPCLCVLLCASMLLRRELADSFFAARIFTRLPSVSHPAKD